MSASSKLTACLALLLHAQDDEELAQAREQVQQILAMSEEDIAALDQQEEPAPSQYARQDEESDDFPSLAQFYADLFAALEAAGSPPDDALVASVDEELEDTGWSVEKDEEGHWKAAEDARSYAKGGLPLLYAALRAPSGYTRDNPFHFNGREYIGGQFIPGAVLATASDSEKARLVQAKEKADARADERKKVRAEKKPTDREALLREIAPHVPLTLPRSVQRRAEQAWRMLQRHHGEHAVTRLEELAGKALAALQKVDTSTAQGRNARAALLQELTKMKHMVGKSLEPPRIPPPNERIVTARAHLSKKANPDLLSDSLKRNLQTHQVEGAALAVEAMDKHGTFVLADGAGAGKTRQILAVASTYAARGKKVLLITKAATVSGGSWTQDGQAMGIPLSVNRGKSPLKAGEIHLSTYESLHAMKGMVDPDTVVIFDEGHGLKNVESARSRHGHEMVKKAGAVMYATATPADQPAHLAYLFWSKGGMGDKSLQQVYSEMGLRPVISKTPSGETTTRWDVDPAVGKAETYKRFSALFDWATREGLMVKREISMKGVDIGFEKIALPPEAHDAMAKIKAAGGGGAQVLMAQRRQQETYKVPATIEMVKKELAEGRKVVIFASRVSESAVPGTDISSAGTTALLKEALAQAGIHDVLELHGGVSAEVSKGAANAFQSGEGRVIISTIESGGTGVNLDDTRGDEPRTQIIMTAPFSGIENVQAAGRVWRLKTQSQPRIRYLFGDTDVDRWNANLISAKMKMLGAVVAGEAGTLDVPDLYPDAGAAPTPEVDVSEESEQSRRRGWALTYARLAENARRRGDMHSARIYAMQAEEEQAQQPASNPQEGPSWEDLTAGALAELLEQGGEGGEIPEWFRRAFMDQ